MTAGDISLVDGVEVLNPDHHIARCREGGKLAHGAARCRWAAATCPAERNKAPSDAGRHDPDRLAVLADQEGQLHGHQRPRRAADRLRQARRSRCGPTARCAGGRGGLRGEDPQGPALHLHQLRGDRRSRSRRRSPRTQEKLNENLWRSVDELELVGPLGQLPAERQHQATSASSCRRPRPRC